MGTGEDAAAVAARQSTVVCDHYWRLHRLRKLHVGAVREYERNTKDYGKIEDYLEPLQSVGEITGRVLCPFGDEDCGSVKTKLWGAYSIISSEPRHMDRSRVEMTSGEIIGEVIGSFDNGHYIVEASCGPRYCRSEADKEELSSGTRVVLDMTTLTIMRTAPLPEEVDIAVARDQMRQIRELLEIPLRHPELLRLIGVKPPGVDSTVPAKKKGVDSTDVASMLFGELHLPSPLKINHHGKKTYREMPPRHHRTKSDRRWQWQR